MGELRTKVATGLHAPITTPYASSLKNLCTRMLEVDANQRPTLASILQLPEIQQRIQSVPGAREADGVAPVLGTIVVPKNIKQLPSHLPSAAYDEIRAERR